MEENLNAGLVAQKRPFSWVTWLLVGSTIAVFILQLVVLDGTGRDEIGDTLAFSPRAWMEHRYWTLVTYAWVHAAALFGDPGLFWLHLVANMIPLVCLGPALEDLLGGWRYLGLYVGGAVSSALIWSFFNLQADAAIIGASGAVFALIAAAGTAAPRARVDVYLFFVLPIRMSLRVLASVLCGLEAVQMIFNWMPEIAHSAHLGGACFGFVYLLLVRFSSRQWPPAV